MNNHRSNQLSLLSGYPEPAATQIRNRGFRPARDGYKCIKKRERESESESGDDWNNGKTDIEKMAVKMKYTVNFQSTVTLLPL